MAQHAHLDPSPFFLAGGPTGILMIHGHKGSPTEVRLVCDALNAAGLTVSAPLLPGHGTRVEDMNRCKWSDYVKHVERAYADLRPRCERVFVAGLSLGSLLTLNLAGSHPELPGAIAYSPATWPRRSALALTPLLRYFVKFVPRGRGSDRVDPLTDQRIWSYDPDPVPALAQLYLFMLRVRRLLPRVTCPLLIVYSTGDGSIHPTSAQRTYDRVRSQDKQIIKIEGSGHVITADAQWRFVAEQTLAWVRQHGG